MPKLKFTITVVEDVNPDNFLEHYDGATTIQECAANQQEWLNDGSCALGDVIEFADEVEVKVEGIE